MVGCGGRFALPGVMVVVVVVVVMHGGDLRSAGKLGIKDEAVA